MAVAYLEEHRKNRRSSYGMNTRPRGAPIAPPGIIFACSPTHSLSLMMVAVAPPLPLPPLKVALFCRDCRRRLLWPPASSVRPLVVVGGRSLRERGEKAKVADMANQTSKAMRF